MAQIREELTLVDNFSSTFNKFESAASASVNSADALRSEIDTITANFANFNTAIESATAALNTLPDSIGGAANEQARVTEETQRTAQATTDWLSKVKSVVMAVGGLKLAKDFIETSDEMSQINAKLNTINDGAQTTAALNDMIYQSAMRSRGSYADTASLVAKLSMNAKEAFGSNAETVLFAENMNKAFKIAGASAQEQASVILQMSQALSGGVLRGQEFNAVMSGAPNIIRTIADYMGVSVGEMRNLAAEGQITSDIVKNAMLSATDSINKNFGQLPATWGDLITKGKNKIQKALQGAFSNFSELINSAEFEEVMNTIVEVVSIATKAAAGALQFLGNVIIWIKDNWASLEPIVIAAGAAFLIFKAQAVGTAIATAVAFIAAHWWILAVVAAIAIVVKACKDMGVSFRDVGRVVGEVLGGIYAVIQNVISKAWNLIAIFVEFFVNVWEHPIDALVDLFFSFAEWAMGLIRDMADELAGFFGLLGAKNLINVVGPEALEKAASQTKQEILGDYYRDKTTIARMDSVDVNETIAAWGQKGEDIGGKIDDLADKFGGASSDLDGIGADLGSLADNMDTLTGENGGIAEVGKVGEIGGDVNLADEDLKVFRDLAEMKYMQAIELQTLAPNINVTVPASEGGTLSAEDVADAIKVVLVEQMAAHTSTAHG